MGESKRRREFNQQQPGERLGDAPVDAAYHDKMVAVVQALDEMFNGEAKAPDKQVGFVLMVFPYGDTTGRCNYMSNGADRRDVIVLMKEMVARFEGQPEMSGRA
jgi:hypothetical protein